MCLFGRRPTVLFDPVAVRNDKEIAEVSRVLVETGMRHRTRSALGATAS